jgi:streptogramin lyase
MRILAPFTRSACAFALASSLTACGSGVTNSPLPGAQSAARAAAPEAKKKVKATIRIVIHRHRHHRRVLVHGHYVSPATQSIAITVTPTSGPALHFNANLTLASNPNCTTMNAQLTCEVSMILGPGSYTADFATYDGLLSGSGGPTDPPTGNELSGNQSVPIVMATGSANAINVVLDGIPTSVVLLPAASSTLSGDMVSGFIGNKCGGTTLTTEAVSVLGADVHGNYIVGPGAPTPSLALPASPPAGFAIATPPPNSPNAFTISHAISTNAQGPATLTATVTPLAGVGGSPISAQVPVTIAGGTQICGLMTEYPITTANSEPTGIVAGSDNNMWFTESHGGGRVAKITTDGTITEYQVPMCGGNQAEPEGIADGPDGNLWFVDATCNSVDTITTGGTISEYSSGISGAATVWSIAAGPAGSGLWFTELSTNKIGQITTTGTITEHTAGLSEGPAGIALGSDGNLWITEYAGTNVGTMNAGSFVTTQYLAPHNCSSGGCYENSIAPGPDGALWFTEQTYGIGRVTIDGAVKEYHDGEAPMGITAGSDDALWFTECTGDRIGRITTDGTYTNYAIPTGFSNPRGIAAGPDGSLWFLELIGNNVGRLQ